MAFDVQTLAELAKCGDCLSPNQKQNVLLYLLNGILENGAGGGGLHNLLSLTHPDTVPGPPTRGALVVGNATPDWEALPIGAANRVLRSDGVDATWSQLVLTTDVTGILPIANGGTNSSAALNNNRIMVSSGGAIVEAAALTNGQLLIGSTGAAPVAAGLTAGTNVTIGTGAGSITINAVMPGGFTGFDNPTASVGLVAVNGVATTAMRSDAAPPLDQSIAPTWTGLHIFAPTTAPAIQINPFGAAAGNTSELRFRELAASGTNYTGFKAADAMAASEIYVLPDAAPSANRFLRAGAVAAGVSTLSWAQISLTADVTGILPVANGGTGTSTAFTQGSVIFAGAAGVYTQDNANFFFDNANNRLGLVTAVPLYTLHVLGPGSFQYGFAAGALVLGADLNATTITVNSRKIGRVNMVSYDGGATNTFLFGGDFTTGANDIYFGGVTAGSQYAATAIHFFTGATQTTTGGIEKFTVNASGVQLPPTGAAAGNTGELRFLELAAGGTNYAGFKAADAMAASEIYVLPNAAPAANRFLQAAAVAGGVSALSWAQVSLTADVTGILPVANGGSGTSTAFTAGSVIFAGAAGVYSQDNANFFWDDTNNRLGLGTASPNQQLELTGSFRIPATSSSAVGIIFQGATRLIHTYGTSNLFIGISAGNFTTTGAGRNVALGANALSSLTSALNNMAIGFDSLKLSTSGGNNVGVGVSTLATNTTGSSNTAIGQGVLFSNTSGAMNTGISEAALFSNTTGGTNVCIGPSAGYYNQAGGSNVFIGAFSGQGTALNDYSFNTFIGTNSAQVITTALSNTGVGYGAGASITSGNNNVLIGFNAGDNLTTGNKNIVIGYNIDSPTATNANTLTIGNLIFGAGLNQSGVAISDGTIGVGVITPLSKFHVVGSAAATVVEIIQAAAAQSANLTEWQSSAAVANTVINAAGNISIPTTTSTVGIIFQGTDRLIHTFATNNLFIGINAGNFTTSGTGSNVGVGNLSLVMNTTGFYNMGFGAATLQSNTTGSGNVAIGRAALTSNTTGVGNLAVGGNALFANITGSNSIAIGGDAAVTTTAASFLTTVGFQSMFSLTSGSFNVGLGYQAGYSITTGGQNIMIGYLAGFNLTTGTGNIVIGHNIYSQSAASANTLTIGNLLFGTGLDGATTALSTGNIGVGVITPLAKFHVTNSAAATVCSIFKAASAQSANLTEWQDSSAVILSKVNSAGNVGVRMAATALTAYLHIAAGTTSASTAPLKLTSGTSMTTAEAGAMEFTTDDLFFTITTGAARKRLLMADATAGLTSGKIPVATTNGRLVDLTASAAYTPTNVTTDRSWDCNATSIDEIADVLATVVQDLQAIGVLG